MGKTFVKLKKICDICVDECFFMLENGSFDYLKLLIKAPNNFLKNC